MLVHTRNYTNLSLINVTRTFFILPSKYQICLHLNPGQVFLESNLDYELNVKFPSCYNTKHFFVFSRQRREERDHVCPHHLRSVGVSSKNFYKVFTSISLYILLYLLKKTLISCTDMYIIGASGVITTQRLQKGLNIC